MTIALKGQSALVDALLALPGMPKQIRRIQIDMTVGEPITMMVEFYPDSSVDGDLAGVIRNAHKRFRLEEE